MLDLTRNVADRARSIGWELAQNLAIQDVIALTFHAYVFVRVSLAPDSPDATVARRLALALLVITACALLLSRAELIRNRSARALTYRLGLFLPMLASYFEMRTLLPALHPELMDPKLFAIDQWLFGGTPALWLNVLNAKPVVEWLSFFYYCYFALLAVMLLPSLLFGQGGRRMQELLAGALLICALGHFLYTLVPGAGPYATLIFEEPLRGGFWWHQVEVTVAAAGAQLDIFPSLHTAYPTYFALHAFAHRRQPPFRWAWPVLAFVALNIVFATLFLRWHWLIDVLAGLLLAFAARTFAVAVTDREECRGTDCDARQAVWEPIRNV